MKFLSPEVSLYIYKSTIHPCMEYCLSSLVDVYMNWLRWFHFFVLEGGLPDILIDCMIFLSPFLDVTRLPVSTVFFPHTARFWNSLPIECFPLTYNLNGFKSRINGHL